MPQFNVALSSRARIAQVMQVQATDADQAASLALSDPDPLSWEVQTLTDTVELVQTTLVKAPLYTITLQLDGGNSTSEELAIDYGVDPGGVIWWFDDKCIRHQRSADYTLSPHAYQVSHEEMRQMGWPQEKIDRFPDTEDEEWGPEDGPWP